MIKNQGYELIFDPPGDGSCQFSALTYFLRAFGYQISSSMLRNQVVEYLQNHWTNEEGQAYELFVGIPWSEYLNELLSDETYGDQITLNAVAHLYNVCIRVISSLGPQAAVDINPGNTQQQTLILGYYAEGQDDHYVCLLQNELMETTGKDYEQESETDEDANMDPENLHPEINDLGDDGIDDSKDEMDNDHCDELHNDVSQNSDNQKGDHHPLHGLEYEEDVSPQSEANWDLQPNGIWFKIIRTVLHQCDFHSLENHVCFVFKNLKFVNHRFFSLASKSIEDLPKIYVNNLELLPKPKRGKYFESIMSLIRNFGSFSGIVLDIKRMLNFSGWNSAWLVLLPCPSSSFIILDFFWKKEKMIFMENFDLNNLFFIDIDF